MMAEGRARRRRGTEGAMGREEMRERGRKVG